MWTIPLHWSLRYYHTPSSHNIRGKPTPSGVSIRFHCSLRWFYDVVISRLRKQEANTIFQYVWFEISIPLANSLVYFAKIKILLKQNKFLRLKIVFLPEYRHPRCRLSVHFMGLCSLFIIYSSLFLLVTLYCTDSGEKVNKVLILFGGHSLCHFLIMY